MDREVKRKTVHVTSIAYLALYFLFPEWFTLIVYASLVIALRFELLRFYFGYLLLFDELLRDSERHRLAGYFYLVLGLSLLVSLAPNARFIEAGILLASLADTAGAIVGRKRGSVKRVIMGKTRSLQGTLAGFTTAILIGLSLFDPIHALILSVIYVANDLFRPGDDNLSNPLVPLALCLL